MSSKSFIFTSESVAEGHPDKLADQISDSVLDAYLVCDSDGRIVTMGHRYNAVKNH